MVKPALALLSMLAVAYFIGLVIFKAEPAPPEEHAVICRPYAVKDRIKCNSRGTGWLPYTAPAPYVSARKCKGTMEECLFWWVN